jgi:hypothetical protein
MSHSAILLACIPIAFAAGLLWGWALRIWWSETPKGASSILLSEEEQREVDIWAKRYAARLGDRHPEW